MKTLSFPIRHRLISFLRDLDVKGIRKLSVDLPNHIFPNPDKIGRHIIKTPDGLKLIIDPAVDKSIELSLFHTGTYEKGILNFIRKTFNSQTAFIDVGANIGLFSLYVKKYFPTATIHAFEAHPQTVEILKQNFSLNSINHEGIHPHALGAFKGKVHISNEDRTNRGGASIVQSSSNCFEIDCSTLDDISIDKKVGIIKIDVEGFELQVLQGAQRTIETDQPILIIEISKERDGVDQTQEIWDFVTNRGYKIFKLKGSKERKSNLVEIKHFKDLPEHDNIICTVI